MAWRGACGRAAFPGALPLAFVLMVARCGGGVEADEAQRQSARALASIAIMAPADLAVVEPTFTVDFEVRGADRLRPGTYAAVLINNNHGANFTINTSAPAVYAASLGLKDMRQMVYDITVVLMGPSGRYAGVYNITTVGVVGSAPAAGDDSVQGQYADEESSRWSAEEIHERLKRRKIVDDEMLEHVQSIAAFIPAEQGEEADEARGAAGCGVPPGDVAVEAVAALLQLWEGAEPPANCFPSAVRDYMMSMPGDGASADALGSFPTAQDLARALRQDVDVEGSASSSLEEVESLHIQLFEKMRAAAPHDPAMGMEGNSGQLDTQRQMYGALSLARSVASVCETGFGAGHSALNWLAGHPVRRIHSFDLGSLGGAKVGEDFVHAAFPQRLSLTLGDSSWTGLVCLPAASGAVLSRLFCDGGKGLGFCCLSHTAKIL